MSSWWNLAAFLSRAAWFGGFALFAGIGEHVHIGAPDLAHLLFPPAFERGSLLVKFASIPISLATRWLNWLKLSVQRHYGTFKKSWCSTPEVRHRHRELLGTIQYIT